jgi:hypothetical protein
VTTGRRTLRRAAIAVLVLVILFPFAYALLVPERRGAAIAVPEVPAGRYRIRVVDWGYHTAIVVPQPGGWMLGPAGEERAPLVEYAWGDRRYYMESNFRPDAVFATLMLPTASVTYVDGRENVSSFAGARGVYARDVDAATLHRLLDELERSIVRRTDGTRAAPFVPRAEYAGRFYPGAGRYLWTRNCNWWTVERLAAAGLASRSTGVVFSGQVAGRLVGFEREGLMSPSR